MSCWKKIKTLMVIEWAGVELRMSPHIKPHTNIITHYSANGSIAKILFFGLFLQWVSFALHQLYNECVSFALHQLYNEWVSFALYQLFQSCQKSFGLFLILVRDVETSFNFTFTIKLSQDLINCCLCIAKAINYAWRKVPSMSQFTCFVLIPPCLRKPIQILLKYFQEIIIIRGIVRKLCKLQSIPNLPAGLFRFTAL